MTIDKGMLWYIAFSSWLDPCSLLNEGDCDHQRRPQGPLACPWEVGVVGVLEVPLCSVYKL